MLQWEPGAKAVRKLMWLCECGGCSWEGTSIPAQVVTARAAPGCLDREVSLTGTCPKHTSLVKMLGSESLC